MKNNFGGGSVQGRINSDTKGRSKDTILGNVGGGLIHRIAYDTDIG